MRLPQSLKRLGSTIKLLFDPSEKNKYLIAVLAALAAGVSAFAAVALRPPAQTPSVPGQTQPVSPETGAEAWIQSMNRMCQDAERSLNTAWERAQPLLDTNPGKVAQMSREDLLDRLREIVQAIKDVAVAGNVAANRIAAANPPASLREQVHAALDTLNTSGTKLTALALTLENITTSSASPPGPLGIPDITSLSAISRLTEAETLFADMKTAFQSLAVTGPSSCATVLT
ncbi:hypothetical protein HD597_005214 [Nonomuraea thailandensis]|uniref:Uncharacterized protein n=1 Tax=Nonomuraea thailandensis TaxID=1188745 RepID=A0A9X2K3B4_9ACTN|nr:hypothetical protein [Nonomuraea thailandensis]MCP2358194.1 hypothetical protein [Nonomuraea thailandensis]